MAKIRRGRIDEQIRAALSEALRSLKDPRVSGLVTIVRCEATGDLKYCKVFVSILGTEEQQKDAMKGLKSASGWLRREVGQRTGLRNTPELILTYDDSIMRGAHIMKLINEIADHGNEEDPLGETDDGADGAKA